MEFKRIKFPTYCDKCGISIIPNLEGFINHIRSDTHNGITVHIGDAA